MKESIGVKSSAESEIGGGRCFGSSCSDIIADWATLWGYDAVVVELWLFLRKWVGLAVAFPEDSGSGGLVLEMGGHDPLRSKSRTRDATLPVLRGPSSRVACSETVDLFLTT